MWRLGESAVGGRWSGQPAGRSGRSSCFGWPGWSGALVLSWLFGGETDGLQDPAAAAAAGGLPEGDLLPESRAPGWVDPVASFREPAAGAGPSFSPCAFSHMLALGRCCRLGFSCSMCCF